MVGVDLPRVPPEQETNAVLQGGEIRRGDHQRTAGDQHPPAFPEKRDRVEEMFDDLTGEDTVHAGGPQRQRAREVGSHHRDLPGRRLAGQVGVHIHHDGVGATPTQFFAHGAPPGTQIDDQGQGGPAPRLPRQQVHGIRHPACMVSGSEILGDLRSVRVGT